LRRDEELKMPLARLRLALALFPLLLPGGLLAGGGFVFLRGDANGTGVVDISDAVFILNFLFLGGPAPGCEPGADTNTSGDLDISDAVNLLTALFLGGATVPPLEAAETEDCAPGAVVRGGTLSTRAHGVRGIAEELHAPDGSRTIRLRHFHYDGGGGGLGTYVVLYQGDPLVGREISEDLQIGPPGYADETLVFPVPEDLPDEAFNAVTIWCKSLQLNFGSTILRDVRS
jgi:hypothetical protein